MTYNFSATQNNGRMGEPGTATSYPVSLQGEQAQVTYNYSAPQNNGADGAVVGRGYRRGRQLYPGFDERVSAVHES
jgi:hypothetical protein